jgi:hypothetical protein
MELQKQCEPPASGAATAGHREMNSYLKKNRIESGATVACSSRGAAAEEEDVE